MENTYRVLIADDHPLARKAIKSLLASDSSFLLVGEAIDGEEAYSQCKELQPDLVLMDIHMPGMNGLEATRLIKQSFPKIKVVILSVSDDIADLFTAIQFGAQGYLLKNMDPDDWITYLHALIDGTADVSRELAGRLFYQFREGDIPDQPSPDTLTPREREILMHVAAGETNRELAEKLHISENTVKNHMKNLLKKLYLDNRVQLASYAVKHGLSLKK
ncbi:response regulator transcription factor [Ammoniphilus sp. CFH 90114]|uniref:response regulator n=1 Tax=Ammoniphilus sp. CFH 90114 TaxID=2493665 RepID=UPI00100F22D5|nr:response regulator transcription factor [Ammoniphilus sp. CFH 90114]RXT14031.1 response regulator transcription factor [Ammoniphilus sp. CFH 90114]